MSSSTSSSDERRWRRCFLGFLGSTAVLVPLVWLVIALADPFDTLHLSPPMDRQPVTRNQRFAYAALARSPRFDSAVTGSSSVLLLDPVELNRDLGGRFVNLSLKLGVPHEEHKLLGVFRRHHAKVRTVIVSIDNYWFLQADGSAARTSRHFPFPDWMYDDDPWNDYAEHFNFHALRHVPRRLRQALGGARPRYRADGFQRFTPDPSLYDLRRVRSKIYGERDPTPEEMERRKRPGPRAPGGAPVFDVPNLRRVLALFPASTEKILLLPPLHAVMHPPPEAAKRGLVEAARAFGNVRILDMWIPSEITRTDTNYWDAAHYTVEIATRISALLAASRDPAFESEVCRVLHR